MALDVTVLYYSANVEHEAFEGRIMANILAQKGDLPLVSVTQTPQPGFGDNVCIGRQPVCYETEFRQIARGLERISTEYVLVAEADTLYPPDYFRPRVDPGLVSYRYCGVWVHYVNKLPHLYLMKKFSHCAQMIRAADWLAMLYENVMYQYPTRGGGSWTGQPVVTFKTRAGVGRKTQVLKRPPLTELPYWGEIETLRERML